jgi:murein DD-endopeptidase MepM/ murein hydrolase activator NlpD
MSNSALEQHVRRRIRVKPLPRPSDFRDFNKAALQAWWFPGELLDGGHKKTPKRASRNTLPGIVQRVKRRPPHPSGTRANKKEKRAAADPALRPGGKGAREGKKPGAFAGPLQFLFGKEGLFPIHFPATFPLFPLSAAALALIISVAALNWNFPSILGAGSPMLGDYSGEAGEISRDLAFYAYPQGSQTGPEEEEIPLDLMETFSWKEYKVQRGDTLSEIARAQELSLGTLIACNGVTNARRLREGETLRIPNMDGVPYTVKAGDNLSAISASSGVPLTVILDVNNLESDVINPGVNLFLPGVSMGQDEIRLALGESFIYPVRGTLSSPYGWRIDPIANVGRFHSAIDLAAPLGTPVRAAMDGRVSRVAVNSVYGIYVIITHPGSYQSLYAHLSAATVKQGAPVTQGSKIGEVGSTGYSTGPHLHFGVFRNNKAINPLEVIQR